MPNSLYFDTLFAQSGDKTTIPDGAQSDSTVSYLQGWTSRYSTAVADGGLDFPRAQNNQALYDITAAIQNWQQQTAFAFITSDMNNGSPYSYKAGVLVRYDAGDGEFLWQSLIDSNTATPGDSNDQWADVTRIASALLGNSTQSGTNYTYLDTDLNSVVHRSNGGTAMIDTLATTDLPTGWSVTIANDDSTAVLVAKAGVASLDGVSTGFVRIGPKQRVTIEFDGTNFFTIDKPLRLRLGAATTIYVNGGTGSDNNAGTTSGTPFATLQAAWDFIVNGIDQAGYQVTMSVANGTYTAGISATVMPQTGPVLINGDTTTPSNVIISTTSADALFFDGPGNFVYYQGLKLQTTTSGVGVRIWNGARITQNGNCHYGACATGKISASLGGALAINANYTDVGNAPYFVDTEGAGSFFNIQTSITATESGTPVYSTAFSIFADLGSQSWTGITFSGGATGKRYQGTLNANCNTNGGGASFFPGNSAGTTATGANYV